MAPSLTMTPALALHQFDSARRHVETSGSQALSALSDKQKLDLYARFKQATVGDADPAARPSAFQFANRAKFDAWAELRGVSEEQARAEYVKIVQDVDSTFVCAVPQVALLQQQQQAQEEAESLAGSGSARVTPAKETSSARRRLVSPSNPRNDLYSPLLSSSEAVATSTLSSTTKPVFRASLTAVPHAGGHVYNSLLEAVGNIRDHGGFPAITHDGKAGRFKSQLLYRSSHFDDATTKDSLVLLNKLAIKTIVDLRGDVTKPSSSGLIVGARNASSGKGNDFLEAFQVAHSIEDSGIQNPQDKRVRFIAPSMNEKVSRGFVLPHMPTNVKIRAAGLKILSIIFQFLATLLSYLPGFMFLVKFFQKLDELVNARMKYHGLKVMATMTLKDLYIPLFRLSGDNLRRQLLVLTEPTRLPSAVHCTFGKDRTGCVTALILHAAGVPREDILADYHMSHTHLDTKLGQIEWENVKVDTPPLYALPDVWGRAPVAEMEQALNALEKEFGSLDAYLDKSLGLGEEWRKQVRMVFVEPL